MYVEILQFLKKKKAIRNGSNFKLQEDLLFRVYTFENLCFLKTNARIYDGFKISGKNPPKKSKPRTK